MASSIFIEPGTGGGTITSPVISNPTFTGQEFEADGTALLPSKTYTSEPTLGLYRSAAGVMTVTGDWRVGAIGAVVLTTSGDITLASGRFLRWAAKSHLSSATDGLISMGNFSTAIGSMIKVDALPTIASGFGASPSVRAGSTPLAGSVNVGTGGAATTGAITFNGTAFPQIPFIVCTCSAGAVPTIATATTGGITFTTSVAWPASTVLNWHAISPIA
jgi:hypothetical protein